MTNGREPNPKRHFVLTWLPWILGLAALAVYLVTLNHSISFLPSWPAFLGMPVPPVAARLAGWTWQPEYLAPAYHLVTYPFHWLPTTWLPVAVNLFSALCAALVLVQLARSVALLPHDRTRGQREREDSRDSLLTFPLAWVPPVLAVAVCALELSFWEHGTNATFEMFDLLLFSYVVRSLLEYRIDLKETRLYWAALVFGVGMTGNPAMVGFFPLFIFALVWTRKLSFFNVRFLGRMALWGLVGLLMCLLLPAIGTFAKDNTLSFWQLLKLNLLSEQFLLSVFPKKTILLLSLTSVLPVFLFSIRWASQFGDPSRIGVILTTIIFHLCHVVVLLACLWVTFDPAFSPRKTGYGFVFLPFYYLGALSVGYYSGYLLLVSRALGTRLRSAPLWSVLFQHATTILILALLVAMPAALIHRNLPQIRLTNGPLQNQLAADLASGLPKSGVILSDDSRRLWIIQDWLARHGRTRDFVVLCTQWLKQREYHSYLKRLYRDWTPPTGSEGPEPIGDSDLVLLMLKLAKEKELCYLHPSFGYYFEFFNAEPNGLTQRLIPHPDSYLVPPPLTPEVIARNERFWAGAKDGILSKIRPLTVPPDPARRLSSTEKIYKAIRLKPELNQQVSGIGALYSRNLVSWAVALQGAGGYEQAAKHLELAHELNPDNVVAEINLQFNKKFRAGHPSPVVITKSVEDQFGKYRSWEEVLTQNGPYDEPSLTYAQGYVYAQGNLLRQSAEAFNRVRTLSTNDLASRLWLAQMHLVRGFPDQALALAQEVRACAERLPGAITNLTDLFTLEASAYFAKQEPDTAVKLIEVNLGRDPGNFQLLAAACKTYADNGRYTNALNLTDRMLQINPASASTWLNQGCFLVELHDYEPAISAFNRVLTFETNNATAVLYRAIASLRAGKLDDALKDYEFIQRQYPKLHQVYFGLGEIYYRRQDTNTALRHFESYLSNAPPNTAESKLVTDRIREFRGQPPDKAK